MKTTMMEFPGLYCSYANLLKNSNYQISNTEIEILVRILIVTLLPARQVCLPAHPIEEKEVLTKKKSYVYLKPVRVRLHDLLTPKQGQIYLLLLQRPVKQRKLLQELWV